MDSRRWIFVLVLVVAGSGVVKAGEPEAPVSAQDLSAPPQGWETPVAGPMTPAPSGTLDSSSPIDLEFLLGLPCAVRVDAVINREDRVAYSLEAIAGLYLIEPFAGAGGRVLWSVTRGGGNAFQINPGVEVDVAPKLRGAVIGDVVRRGTALITPDVQFLWVHGIHQGSQGEIGVELGGGVPTENENFTVIPRASLILGFRF